MKLLQNRWVTGLLVLVAAVVAAYQFIPAGGLHFSRSSPPQASASAAQSPARPGTKVTKQQDQAASTPSSEAAADSEGSIPRRIDRQYVESHFPFWVNSPLRDPFLLLDSSRDDQVAGGGTNSPVATWKLNGIWRQDLSQLAIINNHIYQEGDEVVQGYKLEKIEGDEVWFQGPNGKERLGFRKLGRFGDPNPTNRPPNLSQPRESRPRP